MEAPKSKARLLPATGLHHNIPFDVYVSWDAVNQSRLKPMRQSPLHCKYAMDNPQSTTPAMVMGSALHTAAFEPSVFEDQFTTIPKFDRRTKAGKADYAEAVAAAGDRTIIDEEQMTSVVKMAEAIRSSRAAWRCINAPGQCEVSALWEDIETKLVCKARFDKLIDLGGSPIVIELKTTRNGATDPFSRDMAKLGYHIQAASYLDGHKAATGKEAQHITIAVENEPPYAVAVYMASDETLMSGAAEYHSLLWNYAQCVKDNHWPGYPDKVQVISIPHWAQFTESEVESA